MDFVIPDTRARPADRGAESYVKCTDALVARVVPTLEFELAANGDKLLPLHQLEAIYAGRLKPDGAVVKAKHFGWFSNRKFSASSNVRNAFVEKFGTFNCKKTTRSIKQKLLES